MALKKRQIKFQSNYTFSARSKRLVFLLLPTRFSVFLFRRFVNDNREHNALEAAKFLVDANKIYATRYSRLLPKFLRFCICLADLGLPKNYQKLIIKSIWTTHQNPALRKLVNTELISATSHLSHTESTAQGWKLLTLALNGFGFIQAGTIARTNCLHVALDEVSNNKASRRTVDLAIRGLAESRMLSNARALKNSLPPRHFETSDSDVIDIYLNILSTDMKPSTQKIVGDSTSEICGLSDLINQKSVALVASGEIKNKLGGEIDSHDTVARIKYQGDISTPNVEITGKRCDLTFYTEDLVTKYTVYEETELASIKFLENVKIIITKGKSKSTIGNTPTKVALGRAPTFLTTATSGTLLLFEIIRANPSKIHLYGFDFYTKRQLYSPALLQSYNNTNALREVGLPKNWFDMSSHQKGSANICAGYIACDPKSDFLLIKNLYELSGLIDGTPEVIALLNLTADEYDMKLEEMLGDW